MNATAATIETANPLFDRGSLRKWKVTMRTLSTQVRNISSTFGKIVMALVCASMIGGIFIAPAFADDHGRREGYQHGKYKHSRRGYSSRRPVATITIPPPPVVYAPAPYQSPGISIVFPFRLNRGS